MAKSIQVSLSNTSVKFSGAVKVKHIHVKYLTWLKKIIKKDCFTKCKLEACILEPFLSAYFHTLVCQGFNSVA